MAERSEGMSFDPTDEQRALCASAREFAESTLNAGLAERDRHGPGQEAGWRDLWQKCADFGLFGLCIPQEYGGAGHSTLTTIMALEAIGRGCADNGLTLGINGQIWAVLKPILSFGTDAQKRKYVPGLIDGRLVGAHGLTELETGSDAMSLKTTAEARDGGYVLNGTKAYIGMGPDCDLALVFASTTPDHGAWGVSAFLVEAGDAGFERGQPEEKMGLRSVPLGGLRLTDCWVPEDRRLGPVGAGMSIFQHTMEWERSFIFSSHVGAMARQLDECVAYSRSRETFGTPIGENQSVSNRLAEMRLRVETSRLLLYRAAWLKDMGRPSALEAAMAKLHISEAFAASSLDAVRIFGGRGYLSADGIERNLRDATGGLIYSGTSDIQRQIIARLLD